MIKDSYRVQSKASVLFSQLLCFLLVIKSAVEYSLAVYDELTSDAILYPVKYTTPLIKFATYVSFPPIDRPKTRFAIRITLMAARP